MIDVNIVQQNIPSVHKSGNDLIKLKVLPHTGKIPSIIKTRKQGKRLHEFLLFSEKLNTAIVCLQYYDITEKKSREKLKKNYKDFKRETASLLDFGAGARSSKKERQNLIICCSP